MRIRRETRRLLKRQYDTIKLKTLDSPKRLSNGQYAVTGESGKPALSVLGPRLGEATICEDREQTQQPDSRQKRCYLATKVAR